LVKIFNKGGLNAHNKMTEKTLVEDDNDEEKEQK
jgi:hypothetical protein